MARWRRGWPVCPGALRWLLAWVMRFSSRALASAVSNVRPAIAACSVYVLPSYREGTPRTVLEAMAMGRAVITTDAPGCRETVVHGDNGFLVPVQSVDALEQAMLQFVADPALAPRMGCAPARWRKTNTTCTRSTR